MITVKTFSSFTLRTLSLMKYFDIWGLLFRQNDSNYFVRYVKRKFICQFKITSFCEIHVELSPALLFPHDSSSEAKFVFFTLSILS